MLKNVSVLVLSFSVLALLALNGCGGSGADLSGSGDTPDSAGTFVTADPGKGDATWGEVLALKPGDPLLIRSSVYGGSGVKEFPVAFRSSTVEGVSRMVFITRPDIPGMPSVAPGWSGSTVYLPSGKRIGSLAFGGFDAKSFGVTFIGDMQKGVLALGRSPSGVKPLGLAATISSPRQAWAESLQNKAPGFTVVKMPQGREARATRGGEDRPLEGGAIAIPLVNSPYLQMAASGTFTGMSVSDKGDSLGLAFGHTVFGSVAGGRVEYPVHKGACIGNFDGFKWITPNTEPIGVLVQDGQFGAVVDFNGDPAQSVLSVHTHLEVNGKMIPVDHGTVSRNWSFARLFTSFVPTAAVRVLRDSDTITGDVHLEITITKTDGSTSTFTGDATTRGGRGGEGEPEIVSNLLWWVEDETIGALGAEGAMDVKNVNMVHVKMVFTNAS